MAARPSFQFYPGDWRGDLRLQRCSLASRALLIELMCLMHEGTPYGHLATDGEALSDKEVAIKVGISTRELRKLLSELESRNVLERTPEGTLVSRRMIRDEEIRQARANGGKAGASHGQKGADYGKKGGRPSGEKTPHVENGRGVSNPPLKPPPSSSSSIREDNYPTTTSPRESRSPRSEPAPDPRYVAFLHAAGMSNFPPDLGAMLDEWAQAGANFDEDVLPAVRQLADEHRKRSPGRGIQKARFFDSAVRERVNAVDAQIARFKAIAEANADAPPHPDDLRRAEAVA